ncbi:MAG: D-sedoheptulose 7-phosphate isomerase [archaeon]
MLEEIRKELKESINVKKAVMDYCLEDTKKAIELIIDSLKSENKILLCGNGGSAADTQHVATELVQKLRKKRKALPALSLCTDSSILTAVGNDDGFENIFSRQIEALGDKGDVLIAISTSGNSLNVLKAVEEARKKGMRIIGLTGSNGKLKEVSDVSIKIPSSSVARIQEMHLLIEHIICNRIEEEFKEE